MDDSFRQFTANLAETLARGTWSLDELLKRADQSLTETSSRAWIIRLTERTMVAFPGRQSPQHCLLMQFLAHDRGLRRVWNNCERDERPFPEIDLTKLVPPVMQPASEVIAAWPVRPLVTIQDVSQWLGLTLGELDWFADRTRRKSRVPEGPLRHYRYRWIAKSSGGQRLLEIPKPRLKELQRKILAEILDAIPPHPAAHAFRRGRSVRGYVTPHVGQQVVLHIDLREFFPSIRASQIHALYRTVGYPERVAAMLTGLCTHITPRDAIPLNGEQQASNSNWKRLGSPHLPQGAPTSPALANLVAFRLDCRLAGLSQKVEAVYTRYADDLLFSGGKELARCASRFRLLVTAIAHHEGFEIRARKSRTMHSGTRQQVAGIVLNRQPNIPREEYDALRATLYNCQRHGPTTQNVNQHPHFRDHLLGKINYWSNICPERSRKLRLLFDQIVWP
ncbi:reverse transcriptase family protein [Schlesneria paludicola]|uniref:reverse transcriptase family protein n=1 Tax=Schlesneria paludicola TaxID=360056 RepID=UPI00029A781D|nr:reverse transcriptase family protein [Schlesneria paludicola]